jgi:uncharacterized coiled-coil DUF342 family protein
MITTILITVAITVTVTTIFGWLTYLSLAMKHKTNLQLLEEAQRHIYERIRELEDQLNKKANSEYTLHSIEELQEKIDDLENSLEECRNSKCC